MSPNTRLISPEHTVALNAVKLDICGIFHGEYLGSGLLGRPYNSAYDSDFDQVRTRVEQLDAGRGDTVAVENAGAAPGSIPTPLPFYAKDGSPLNGMASYVPPERREPDGGLLEFYRDQRVLSPMQYAAGVAQIEGIPRFTADVTDVEWQAMEDRIKALPTAGSLFQRIKTLKTTNEIIVGERNPIMLARLGDIACNMMDTLSPLRPLPTEEVPILQFFAGAAHVRGMARILRANNVPFSASTPFVRWLPEPHGYYLLSGLRRLQRPEFETILHRREQASLARYSPVSGRQNRPKDNP